MRFEKNHFKCRLSFFFHVFAEGLVFISLVWGYTPELFTWFPFVLGTKINLHSFFFFFTCKSGIKILLPTHFLQKIDISQGEVEKRDKKRAEKGIFSNEREDVVKFETYRWIRPAGALSRRSPRCGPCRPWRGKLWLNVSSFHRFTPNTIHRTKEERNATRQRKPHPPLGVR